MDYKDEFNVLVADNRLEEARIYLEKYKINALEEPFYYANMGWLFNHMERYEEAEMCLKKGLFQFPDDAWMYSQLGFCYNRQDRVKEGLALLLKSLDMGNDEAWIHGEIGWCYKDLMDYPMAVNYFENALMEDPRSVWTLSQAAGTYALLGKDDIAEEYFLKSYAIDSDVDAAYDIVNFYREHNYYEKVLPFLDEITDPTYASWKESELGSTYFHLAEYTKAYEHYMKAMEDGRDDTGIRNELGDICQALNQLEEANIHYNTALTYYEKALKNEDDRRWIYQEMVWIAHKQEAYEKKLAYLLRAQEELGDDPWFMYHFARTYTDLNEYAKAEDACQQCIKHGEEKKEILDLYAWNMGRNHKEDEALKVLEDRRLKYGEDEWLLGEIGWDYAQKKLYDKARLHFMKAHEVNINNAAHVSMIGWCLLKENDIRGAKSYVEEAIRLGRNDGWAHATLAEIYEKLEERDKALFEYKAALDMNYESEWVKEEIERLERIMKPIEEPS